MGGLFITGTDTDVGKTMVTGILARMLRQDGLDLGVWKPVQSGHALHHSEGDVMRLKTMSGIADDPSAMCLHAVMEPLAPSLALSRAGIHATRRDLLNHLKAYKQAHKNILIEGAGGFFVPMTEDTTVADLACEVSYPVLIVARPSLGTVNHTALTAAYARQRGLEVAGVIISGMPEGDDRMEWANIPMIEEYAQCPVLAVLPWFSDETADARADSLRKQWPSAKSYIECFTI